MAKGNGDEIVKKEKSKKSGKKKVGAFFQRHRKLTIFLIILIILGFIISRIVSAVKQSQVLLNNMMNGSLTAEVTEENLVNSLSATGVITSVETVVMTSTVTGVDIEELNVALGDRVEAGQIVCVLNSDDIENGLADMAKSKGASQGRAGIEVNAAKRGLTEALTTQSIDAERAEKDIKDAYNDVNSIANDCQEALDKYNSAKDAVTKAENNVKNKKAELDRLNSMASSATSDGTSEADTAKKNFDDTKDQLIADITGMGLPKDEVEYFATNVGSLTIGNAKNVNVINLYAGADATAISKIETALVALRGFESTYQTITDELKGNSDAQSAMLAAANAQYTQACAELETAKSVRDVAKSNYEALAKSVENGWDLYNQKVRLKEDTERADAASVAARNDNLKSANINAGVATLSDDSTIRKYEQQIDDCVIKAGISGTVTSVNVKEGDMYAGGAIITIEDTSSYEVTANIGEYDIAKVSVGQKVTIKTNGTGDEELEGKVREISPRANANTVNGVTYPIKIAILTKNDNLRLDMTAKINIVTEEKENALCVPYDAVLTDEDGNFYINVLDGDAPLTFEDLQNPLIAAAMTEDQKLMAAGEKEPDTHKVFVKKGLQNNYFIEVIGIDEELNSGVVVVYPNDTSYTDIMEYISVNGGY